MLRPWTCVCGQQNAGPAACSRCFSPPPPDVVEQAAVAEPPRRTRARWLTALAIGVAVLLIVGLVAVLRDGGGDGGPAPVTIEVTPDGLVDSPPPAGTRAAELANALPALMRFVVDKRGLGFREPVKVTLLADGPFRERLREEQREEAEERSSELETTERVLRALGLLDAGIDLEKVVDDLFSEAVAGFYDPKTDDLVVRGDELTPGVRITLVHELTHALQDQHFDIHRPELDDRDDEAASGLSGLVEGDASRIDELYRDTLDPEEQKEAEQSEIVAAAGIDPSTPPVVLTLVAFPYLVGPEFTRHVVEEAGQGRLDAAFADPPTTSEQLLHPERYIAGDAARDVPKPEPDGKKIDEGVLGELGLLLVLQPVVGAQRAARAAEGWGGDWYVAWRDGDRTCVRTTIVMDSSGDTQELRSALTELAKERSRVRLTGDGPFTFTSCG